MPAFEDDPPSAESLVREALALVDGRDRFTSAQARVLLAHVQLRQGRASAEALFQIEDGIAEFTGMVPDDHVLLLSARVMRAEAQSAVGRRAEALAEIGATSARLETLGAVGARVLDRARQVRALLDRP